MNNGTMLNAYPDSLGGHLSQAVKLLGSPAFQHAFRDFYILPSLFQHDLDRGFSVISYDLNRELAEEEQLRDLRAMGISLKLDFVLNHLSVLSPQFQRLLREGEGSPDADFFINWNQFWENRGVMTEAGYIQPDAELIRSMFFRKPGLPLLMVRMPDGREVPYWNTFYQEVRYPALSARDVMACTDLPEAQAQPLAQRINEALRGGTALTQLDWAGFESAREPILAHLAAGRTYLGQMDVNLSSEAVWAFYQQTLQRLADYGASIVRLDAFAYTSKVPGKRNFFNEPETWEILERLREMAQPLGLTLLPEIHASYAEGRYRELARKGYPVYDFFLPGLLIDAIENSTSRYLAMWAGEMLRDDIRVVNMLGCHDGIPLLDLRGLLPEERIQGLIDLIVSRGGLVKDLHGQKNVYYQVNATYYSALGCDDRKLLLARAIQLFMPGKPQIWYLDLFAGRNDHEAVRRGGAAGHKEINRTNLNGEQIQEALGQPVVQKQLALLRMRNQHAAFAQGARIDVSAPCEQELVIRWVNGESSARLHANLMDNSFHIVAQGPDGCFEMREDESIPLPRTNE